MLIPSLQLIEMEYPPRLLISQSKGIVQVGGKKLGNVIKSNKFMNGTWLELTWKPNGLYVGACGGVFFRPPLGAGIEAVLVISPFCRNSDATACQMTFVIRNRRYRLWLSLVQ